MAPNQLAGLRRAGSVVLVSADASAPEFQAADHGIVADWRDALPALRSALRRQGVL